MPVATQPRLKIIDTDTHYTEPHDLWTKRAPASLKDRVPQVRILNGEPAWVMDGDHLIGFGANPSSSVLKDGSKVKSIERFIRTTIDEVHPGSYDPKARLSVMNETGVFAQIIYPNVLGFGGHKASDVDPALRSESLKIFNDAMAEMQGDSGGRLFPMCVIPWWDQRAAIAELERCTTMGLRGVAMTSDTQDQKDKNGDPIPDLGSPYWDPLWEAAQSLNMPINFHIGANDESGAWVGSQGWPTLAMDLATGLGATQHTMHNGRVIGNIIYSGLLDRHPKLHFVSVESGIGWIAYFLESLDYQHDEIADRYKFDLKPSEYFKRNFLGCFWFEKKNLAYNAREIGIDNCMFETDFPHPTSLYPLSNIEDRLPDLTPEERAKVLSLNAARVYRIPLS